MNKRFLNMVLVLAASAGIALSGCGGGSSGTADSSHTLSGVVSASEPVSGSVTLQDSSTPAAKQTTRSDEDGKYSFEISRLKAPFILSAEAPASGTTGTVTMYSFAEGAGRANINPFSHATVAAAAELSDDDEMHESRNRMERIRYNHKSVIKALKAKLAPLFVQYGVTGDPVNDDYDSDRDDDDSDREHRDRERLDALFSDVKISIDKGNILVTNKQTGGVIFKASVSNIDGGTFYPGNLPGGSSGTPGACTYTYSAWGACQSNGTQTRTMLTSSPAGCTGTPDLSRTCTYTPPTQACTYTYSAWGACQSDGTQTRTMLTSSPAGCTGTPYLSRTCTYVPPVTTCNSFTYSAWGACQSNNTQTRTVQTSSPAGCTGGTPVLSQACTYTPPTPACGSCHAIPPSSGRHSRHTSFATCSTCHGSGYSSTAVNSATHNNGTRDIVSSLNYNASTRTCGAPGCHGSRTW